MAKIAVKSQSKSQNQNVNRQDIEKLAYQLFAERGYEHGHDQEDWSRAEAILKARKN